MVEEMKGLDDWIMGVHLSHEDEVPHKCLVCGKTRLILMLFDMGGWFYVSDDEGYCCDAEMQLDE